MPQSPLFLKNLKFSFVDYMENTNFTLQTHIHGENVH